MKSKLSVGIITLVLVSLLVMPLGAGCAKKPAEEEPIVIGMLSELSGFLVAEGTAAMQGATLAMEMVDYKVAGKTIKFVVEDTATDTAQTMDKVRKLVEGDGAKIIVGPIHAGCVFGIAPYLEKMKVPYIGIESEDEGVLLQHNWVWLPGGVHRQSTYPLGIYAYDDLGYRTATTLGADFSAGHEFIGGFADSFTAKGGTVVQQQWYPMDVKDFTPYIVGLKDADVLVCSFLGMSVLAGHRQIKEIGIDMPILETPGATFLAPIQAELGDIPVGMRGILLYHPTMDTPGNKEFVEAFKKRWNDTPAFSSANAYVSVQIAFQAIEKLNGDLSDPEALSRTLDETSIESIFSHCSFAPGHLPTRSYYIYEYAETTPGLYGKQLKSYVVKADRSGDKLSFSMAK